MIYIGVHALDYLNCIVSSTCKCLIKISQAAKIVLFSNHYPDILAHAIVHALTDHTKYRLLHLVLLRVFRDNIKAPDL